MARQARRSTRSLSASSYSSLSSLTSSSPSINPLSSLFSSGDESEEDTKPGARGGNPQSPLINPPGDSVPPITSKRKRPQNKNKKYEMRTKRQKVKPRKRKREGSKRDRIDKAKLKKAEGWAIHSNGQFSSLGSSKSFEHRRSVFRVQTVVSKGVKVIRWDGV